MKSIFAQDNGPKLKIPTPQSFEILRQFQKFQHFQNNLHFSSSIKVNPAITYQIFQGTGWINIITINRKPSLKRLVDSKIYQNNIKKQQYQKKLLVAKQSLLDRLQHQPQFKNLLSQNQQQSQIMSKIRMKSLQIKSKISKLKRLKQQERQQQISHQMLNISSSVRKSTNSQTFSSINEDFYQIKEGISFMKKQVIYNKTQMKYINENYIQLIQKPN